MNYLSEYKDWKYHLKSAAVTFFSVFVPLFSLELWNAFGQHITTMKPEDVTIASMLALFIALIRVIIVAGLKTVITFVVKIKDRSKN